MKVTTNVVLSATACLFAGLLVTACKPVEEPQACSPGGDGDLSLHVAGSSVQSEWPSWGGDAGNTHHAATESRISPANVNQLQLRWSHTTTGSVSTNPTVAGDVVYFPDWGPKLGGLTNSPSLPGGQLYALNRWSGEPVWQRAIREYNDNDYNNISRSAPAIAEDLLIIGDIQNAVPFISNNLLMTQEGRQALDAQEPCGGYVYALQRETGDLVWKTRIGTDTFDQITQSPIVHEDTVYVGVSSQESAYAMSEAIDCCEFKGSMVALDLHNGEIKWRQAMTRDVGDEAFSGASVWAGAPTIDPQRNSVYVATGNNYDVPESYKQCVKAASGQEQALAQCAAQWPHNYFDSIVALDMTSGDVKWVMSSLYYDGWNAACDREELIPLLPGSDKNCPDPKGPDSDFAQPAMLTTVMKNGQSVQRLLAGTKGGFFYSIDPDNGQVDWVKQVGPGSGLGGMEFGAATDGQRVYVQNANFNLEPHTLTTGMREGETIEGGYWAALDAATGTLLWETPVPTVDLPMESQCEPELVSRWGFNVCVHPVRGLNRGPAAWAIPVGPLTVANGVVYAGVSDLDGTMVAMDASSGAILWEYQAGASIASAPTIVDGRLYWGIGYKYGVEGNQLLSFALPTDQR